MPGPSKRTLLIASVLETYRAPLTGLAVILNRVVPTCAKAAVWARLLASTANTSVSGRLKRTEPSQERCNSSSQWPVVSLYLTMRPTSGAGSFWESVFGPGLPPGLTLLSSRVHGVLG